MFEVFQFFKLILVVLSILIVPKLIKSNVDDFPVPGYIIQSVFAVTLNGYRMVNF
jgi:hypothetical protein